MNDRPVGASSESSGADSSAGRARTQARKIVWAQLVVTILVSLGFWTFVGQMAGISAFAGGMINVVANLLFVRSWFASYGTESPIQRVLGFYVAEVVKLLVTVALLALAIGFFKFSFLPLFVAFVATLAVFWL